MAYNKPNFHNIKSDKNHNHDDTYSTKEEVSNIAKAVEGLKTEINYDVEIISTNGNIFKNGQISTKLMAIVRRGSEDITSTIDANRFKWSRISNDIEGDLLWNTNHFSGTKEITITKDDVNVRATFNCSILD